MDREHRWAGRGAANGVEFVQRVLHRHGRGERRCLGSEDRQQRAAAKGYRYIKLDEGWWEKRREDGRMLVRTEKFPSPRTGDGRTSFRPFTAQLHAMGLKAALYSDLGRNTCAQAYMPDEPNLPRGNVREREVGLYGHIDRDIGLYFGEWGFDYIKIDGCGLRAYGPDSALVKSGRYREHDPILDLRDVNKSDVPAVRNLFEQVSIGGAITRDQLGRSLRLLDALTGPDASRKVPLV